MSLAYDRAGRAQLVRYAARPPFAEAQLELIDEEQVRFTLRRPTRSAQRQLLLHPLTLLRRLACCPSQSIDIVLMASVFTHMYPAEVLRYLREIRRVLKPGGSALLSFFLLGLEGATGNDKGVAYPMTHALTPYCRYSNADDPLFAISYEWAWLQDRIKELGLGVATAPRGGTWAGGRPTAKRWQDFVVLRR